MDTNKVLASLSYFSILFAAIIFPLVLLFVSESENVKAHAKKALVSQLIPLVSAIMLAIAFLVEVVVIEVRVPFMTIIGMIILGIICFIVLIWNIVKGIKVFQ